jgi:serine/threonine-protein kinase
LPPCAELCGASTPPKDVFGIVGTIVDGRYHVQRVVGEGGFGVAYKALHVRFGSSIALKVLKLPAGMPIDERRVLVDRFVAEGKVLFELSGLHASIVRALETSTLTTSTGEIAPFLVLEWLEGFCLDVALQARRTTQSPAMTVPDSLGILSDPAEGLSVAHARGVAHRDIKPGNLFLSNVDGRVKTRVLDFGLAKIISDSPSVTALLADTAGSPCPFTPAYGAPEQWLRRLGATGPWTDVYGLALTFVEMVAGRSALQGNDSAQLMAACLDEAVRPTPRSLGIDVGDAMESVLRKALSIDPRDRYLDMRSFWSALCQAARWKPSQEALSVDWLRLPSSRRSAPSDVSVSPATAPLHPPTTSSSRLDNPSVNTTSTGSCVRSPVRSAGSASPGSEGGRGEGSRRSRLRARGWATWTIAALAGLVPIVAAALSASPSGTTTDVVAASGDQPAPRRDRDSTPVVSDGLAPPAPSMVVLAPDRNAPSPLRATPRRPRHRPMVPFKPATSSLSPSASASAILALPVPRDPHELMRDEALDYRR